MDLSYRRRRAFAAYVSSLRWAPPSRADDDGGRRLSDPLPTGSRRRFLQALTFLTTLNQEPTDYSEAARAAGIPRGTVSSWISRYPEFAAEAHEIASQPATLEDLFWEADDPDFTKLDRICTLPEIEFARIAVGEIPSARFYEVADAEYLDDWDIDYPNWRSPYLKQAQ
jgi:hypothetical protein